MSLLGVELSDAGIRVAGSEPAGLLKVDGDRFESPGFALPEKKRLIVGAAAEGKAKPLGPVVGVDRHDVQPRDEDDVPHAVHGGGGGGTVAGQFVTGCPAGAAVGAGDGDDAVKLKMFIPKKSKIFDKLVDLSALVKETALFFGWFFAWLLSNFFDWLHFFGKIS